MCVSTSQGLVVSRSDPAEGLQAAACAGQQQGEAGHRSGRQTEARRHQPGIIKHVSKHSETQPAASHSCWTGESKYSFSFLSVSRRACWRKWWASWFHTESWWSSSSEGVCVCLLCVVTDVHCMLVCLVVNNQLNLQLRSALQSFIVTFSSLIICSDTTLTLDFSTHFKCLLSIHGREKCSC